MRRHIFPVKYLFIKDKKFYKLIYQLTGIFPSNTQIFKVALTHKSVSRNLSQNRVINNERLEFLGDAILAAIVADALFTYFPFKKEGFLTKMRARIVSREQLNEIALGMGLQFHVVAQSRIAGTKNIYGNALEALIGAIYIDKGFKETKKFILERLINNYIDLNKLSSTNTDYKSQLLEWTQKNKVELIFNDEEIESTDVNNQYFKSTAIADEKYIGVGKGLSKKEAQQNAAKKVLERIQNEQSLK